MGHRRQAVEPTTSNIEIAHPQERSVPGPLATVSDVVLENCRFPAFLGALTSLALLGYHITEKSESLREITETPLLTFRAGYSNRVIYDLFEDLGPEGRAEYQYINVLSTGVFPALVALCFSIVIGQVFQRANLPHEWNLLPLVFLVMATAENLGISYLLYIYPGVQANVAAVVGILAGFKVRLLTYMALSVVLGTGWLIKVVVQRQLGKKQT